MTTTTRMGISHLTAAQAQKHVTVNAGFDRVDALWNLLVEDIALTAPPGGESEGQAWIVASPATGDWVGHEDELALFFNGGYEFIAPFDGLTAWFSNNRYTYYSGAWNATPGLTNLTVDRDATTVTVESDTGTDAVLPAATGSLAGVMTAADKAAIDAIFAAYLPPVQDVTALTALAEADLADKVRIFVEDENGIFHYDAEAVSGDHAPDDQTGGAGFWIAIPVGGSAVAVDDEGSEVLAAASRLNFEGAGVTVTDAGGGEATITIPGGGGGVSDGDKGDITVTSSGAVWTIDAAAVTLAKLADLATARILGRTTAGTGAPEALTAAQATALLDAFTSSLKGLVPASGGGTTNFLRADGSWAAPAGGGALLTYKGGVRLKKSSSQSVNNLTVTDVTWQTEVYDDLAAFDSGSSTVNVVVPSGISRARVSVYGQWAASTAAAREIYISISGAYASAVTVPGISGGVPARGALTSGIVQVSPSDIIKLILYHNHGSALSFDTELVSSMTVDFYG